MKIPMQEKYVDEIFPFLFEFGSSETGMVDLATEQNPCVITLPKEVADKVLTANKKYQQELYQILCK